MSLEKKLLIMEQDCQVSIHLEQFFDSFFSVSSFNNGLQGLVKTIELKPEVIILDHSLLNIDSLDLCRQIRQSVNSIIMVIGKTITEERVLEYYEAGADDVIVFPINYKILLYKIKSKLSRSNLTQPKEEQVDNIIKYGNLTLNRNTFKTYYNKVEYAFTKKEFSILWTLVKHQDEIVTRAELLKVVWSYDHFDDDRMIDTHLNRMRKKLKQHNINFTIKTVWGIGYKLQMNDPVVEGVVSLS